MATVTKGVLKLHTKWTARRLAADAMFAAMVTVLAAAAIKTGNLKITIEAMPGVYRRTDARTDRRRSSAASERCCISCCPMA